MRSLKPCPFCGGEVETDIERAGQAAAFCDLFRVYCMDCGTQSPEWSYTKADAVTAWNTRASIPVTDEMVERGVVEIIDAQRALGADPLSWDEASQKDKADAMAVMRAALTAALGDER